MRRVLARCWIKKLRRSATAIQRIVRSFKIRLCLLDIKWAVETIQRIYRGSRGRDKAEYLRRSMGMRLERTWAPAESIQNFWRCAKARRARSSILRKIERENRLALRLQLAWYKYKNEFPVFLTMRCYGIKEEEDEALGLEVETMRKASVVRRVQTKYRSRRIQMWHQQYWQYYASAVTIQSLFRRVSSYHHVKVFRAVHAAARLVQRAWRGYFHHRHGAARKIQRMFWVSMSSEDYSPLLKRLRRLRKLRRGVDAQRLRRSYWKASTSIQALVRGRGGRRIAQMEMSANRLQYFARCALSRKALHKLRSDFLKRIATRLTAKFTASALKTSALYLADLWHRSAITIQSAVRAYLQGRIFRTAYRQHCRRRDACVAIQALYRRFVARNDFKKKVGRASRKRKNRFNDLANIRSIAFAA